ncbi:NlpC/P60 family protein [Granulicoccus phenolivorans]|uniref:NlpC/P60 family protein n=1 Tax=Granulicoccus phenolivorans TaxID=266854 RepID=UPI0004220904|nr:NlpC/P60 family protein [Granulicoccus phenolivorans]
MAPTLPQLPRTQKSRTRLIALVAAAVISVGGSAAVVGITTADAAPAGCSTGWSRTVIKQGSRGDVVKSAQCLLNRHGANLAVDGVFGPRTEAAVIAFQQARPGLAVDGVVGQYTWAALKQSPSGSSTPAPKPPAGEQAKRDQILAYARSKIGSRYVWGASGPSTFDCSGLVQAAYRSAGINLQRTSDQQAAGGKRISKSQARPGDLVYWPGHIAIYAGNGQIIDAGNSRTGVSQRAPWGSPTYYAYF